MTVKNQSDCKIRYRALSKKNKCSYLTTKRYNNYKNLNYALKRMFPKRPTGTRYLTLFLCHQLLQGEVGINGLEGSQGPSGERVIRYLDTSKTKLGSYLKSCFK